LRASLLAPQHWHTWFGLGDAQVFHRFIEDQVRHAPDQYWWIHRRFKGLSPDYPDYYRGKPVVS
jgi:KDO2-lipid IV(A) lauroyltransferase